ncbi:MAG TPA: hypothetical protein VFC19_30355 [Candidatus Limnocylindrales bacterium]|nr:hypothetical protein [Candidatus Limnocylindrales bacterium]
MYDDEQLRELMLAVEVPRTSADIARAKATGRRRARRNRIAIGVVVILAISGTTYFALDRTHSNAGQQFQPAQSRTSPVVGCTVEVLEVPAGGRARAVAVDPAGRTIVGTVYNAQGQGNAVRFEGGRSFPYSGATGSAVAINADGLLVGYDDVDQASHTLGWTYRDGTKSMLAKLNGFLYTIPIGVNARGDVVGAAIGDALDDTRPVLWPADKPGTVRQLAVPTGFGERDTIDSRAIGVADDGTIVGSAHGAPIRWAPDGTPSALPVPPGYRYATVEALRGRYVYGWVNVIDSNRNAAVRWDLDNDTMKVLEGAPYDVTDGTPDGWTLTSGGDTREPARITPDGAVELLPLPQGELPARTGMEVLANAISDDGATIAGATWSDDQRPVIWRC